MDILWPPMALKKQSPNLVAPELLFIPRSEIIVTHNWRPQC